MTGVVTVVTIVLAFGLLLCVRGKVGEPRGGAAPAHS